MAKQLKRKASPQYQGNEKKPRYRYEYEDSSRIKSAHSQEDEGEKYWAAKGILEENPRTKLYLVDWESDPDTGERYEPTWVR